MSLDIIKKFLAEALVTGGTELEKLNPEGYRIIRRICESLFIFAEDDDTILLIHTIGSFSPKFFENEIKKENGKKFLKKMGGLFKEIGKAYQEGDSEKINNLIRQVLKLALKRYQQSPRLSIISKEK